MTADTDASSLCLEETRSPIPKMREKLPSQKLREKKNGNEEHTDVSGWTPLVVLGGITCCLGSAFPAGFNIGVLNNPANIIQEFCNHSFQDRYDAHVSNDELMIIWSTIVSIFLVGGITGSFVGSWMSDKYGRRGALACGNACGLVGAVLFFLVPFLNSVETLMIGRFLVGLSGGIAMSVLPTYLTEIAPLKQRGAVGVLFQLGVILGIFFSQIASLSTILSTKNAWHIMLASFAPLCLISLILLRVLPESPKYLYIIKRKESKALQELRRLRSVSIPLLQDEIHNLQKEATIHTTMDTWTFRRVLTDPSVRLPLLLVCALQLAQQLCGINAVFYYSNMIFEKSNLGPAGAQYATLGTGLISISVTAASIWLNSHFGRRKLFLNSSYLSAGCLIVLYLALKTIDLTSFMPWICTIAVLGFVLSFGIGLGPIPCFIGSELFEVGPRPAAMALGSACNWGGSFLIGMLFPILENIIGPLVFLLFAGITISIALFVRHYLPETQGVDTTLTASKLTQGFASRRNHTGDA